MRIIELFKAVFLGIVEGITEWLPISSTGHMILVDEFLKLNVGEEFKELFFVVVQLGAILAVPVLFFDKLWPFSKKKTKAERDATISLWLKVIVGALPAGIIGLLLGDLLESVLYNPWIVAAALVVYGIAFIVIERLKKKTGDNFRVTDIRDLTYTDALKIGAFQILSLVPGTSRSGSTIIGGMLSGVSRVVASEFSFFMAIPLMAGASGYKLLKFALDGVTVTTEEIVILLIGIVVSFLVSLAVIKFLIDFVKRHTFTSFGIYRIVLGLAVISYFIFA